jgi:hypothetical protein
VGVGELATARPSSDDIGAADHMLRIEATRTVLTITIITIALMFTINLGELGLLQSDISIHI